MIDEDAERRRVVAEALSWVGTPFRDLAASKGPTGGVDCAMLLVRAYVDAGVIEQFDPRPYHPRFFLAHDEERYLGWLERYGAEIDEASALPGDVLVYKMGRCFAHGAIVIDDQRIVHAFFKEKVCTTSERFLTELLFLPGGKPRPRKALDMWARRR